MNNFEYCQKLALTCHWSLNLGSLSHTNPSPPQNMGLPVLNSRTKVRIPPPRCFVDVLMNPYRLLVSIIGWIVLLTILQIHLGLIATSSWKGIRNLLPWRYKITFPLRWISITLSAQRKLHSQWSRLERTIGQFWKLCGIISMSAGLATGATFSAKNTVIKLRFAKNITDTVGEFSWSCLLHITILFPFTDLNIKRSSKANVTHTFYS